MSTHIERIADDQARAFAVACYDSNSGSELVNAAMVGPDETDLQTWGIDADQYYDAINSALADIQADCRQAVADFNNFLDDMDGDMYVRQIG